MSLTFATTLELLALLLAANGAPVLAKRLLGERWSTPLDCGWRFFDGLELLGPSKTLRGMVAGVAGCTLVATLLGYPWSFGAAFGLASLTGDALSSFIKRRLRIPASGMALGLDQVPESALPLWLFKNTLALSALDLTAIVVLFSIGGLLLSRLMYQLGIRDQPY